MVAGNTADKRGPIRYRARVLIAGVALGVCLIAQTITIIGQSRLNARQHAQLIEAEAKLTEADTTVRKLRKADETLKASDSALKHACFPAEFTGGDSVPPTRQASALR